MAMEDKGRILVVDDDKDVRDTIREYFEFCAASTFPSPATVTACEGPGKSADRDRPDGSQSSG